MSRPALRSVLQALRQSKRASSRLADGTVPCTQAVTGESGDLRHVDGSSFPSAFANTLGQIRAIQGPNHTAKWMQRKDQKSPQELISEVPPIEILGPVAACQGGKDPALGHPVEYIKLDTHEPSVCKYCGLRYIMKEVAGAYAH